VLAEAFEAEGLVSLVNLAVGANFFVAVARGPISDFGVKTFAVADDGRKQEEVAAFFGFGDQARAELIAGLRGDGGLTLGTILCSEPCEKKTEEMINFGDGGNGAFAAAATDALLNAHSGREAGDEIHFGARHLFDKLARVGAHGVEEATLAFSEDDVESERAFAGTADAGHDDELAARDLDGDIFEIVLARALNADGVRFRNGRVRKKILAVRHGRKSSTFARKGESDYGFPGVPGAGTGVPGPGAGTTGVVGAGAVVSGSGVTPVSVGAGAALSTGVVGFFFFFAAAVALVDFLAAGLTSAFFFSGLALTTSEPEAEVAPPPPPLKRRVKASLVFSFVLWYSTVTFSPSLASERMAGLLSAKMRVLDVMLNASSFALP